MSIGKLGVYRYSIDIEGVEIDPQNRDGETPLHLAVKYTNNEEPEHGYFIVDNMLDAGSDPRIKDKHNLKPKDYVSSDHEKLIELLESAEYAILWSQLRLNSWLSLKMKGLHQTLIRLYITI